jgi:hypothetical protein
MLPQRRRGAEKIICLRKGSKSLLDIGLNHWFDLTNMGFRKGKKFKKNLSAHQKQIRFFTRLCLIIIILATTLIFWLVNR